VDSAWEQNAKRLEAMLREMVGVKRAARRLYGWQSPALGIHFDNALIVLLTLKYCEKQFTKYKA